MNLPPCTANPRLFSSVKPEHHERAKAICATCPRIDWCRGELKKAQEAATGDRTVAPEGTWAGRLLDPGAPRKRGESPCGTPRPTNKLLMLDHHRGMPRLVDATGTRRRIEALGALGWTGAQIGVEMGVSGAQIGQLRAQRQVTRPLAARMVEVYERLATTRPPETTRTERHNASRQRNKAARLGWLPPLAWLDIDDPDEHPDITAIDDLPDPVVVDRILAGDRTLRPTKAERWEVIRRWPGTDVELERIFGWNVARERREMRAAEGVAA